MCRLLLSLKISRIMSNPFFFSVNNNFAVFISLKITFAVSKAFVIVDNITPVGPVETQPAL